MKNNNRTPLVTTYNPQARPLQHIIKDLQSILQDDPSLSQALGERPLLAFRQPPNLKRILTSNYRSYNRNTKAGAYPCNRPRCQLCPHIYTDDTITGPNQATYSIKGSFTCSCTNVIYATMCRKCPSALYIGQTGQSLRQRINGHKSDIRNCNTAKPVGEHFNLPAHSLDDLLIAVLKQMNNKSQLQRETAELELICKFDSVVLGLNRDYGFFSHYNKKLNYSTHLFKRVLSMFCCSFPVWHQRWKFGKAAQPGQIVLVREDEELAQLRGLADAVGLSNACYAVSTLPTRAEIESLPAFPRDKLYLHNLLGSGAFGDVYEGTAVDIIGVGSGEVKVAVKTLKKGATDYEKSEFLKEAHLMSKFNHPHILKLLGVCLSNEPQYIILELMEGGDLLSYLRGARGQKFRGPLLTVADVLDICLDICKGCVYLEKMHFIHRDLAARNCLVSVKEYTSLSRTVKIGDFGLARDVYKNDYYRKRGEGLLPVRWMAPESLIDGVFTNRSDVWAFGVLVWETLTLGHQPYPGYSNLDVLHHVRSGGRLELPNNCPDDLWHLMTSCWAQEPHNRPAFCYIQDQLQELRNSPLCCTPQLENSMLPSGVLNQAFEHADGDAACTDSESILSAVLMETRNNEGLNYLVLMQMSWMKSDSSNRRKEEKAPHADEERSKGKYPAFYRTFRTPEGVNYASDNDK
uniref:Tyrosine-protein kinase receptor n=1 Tax=Pelusios castaneus TaxID=367368 RepID=A0A8C8SIF0_9SAUR